MEVSSDYLDRLFAVTHHEVPVTNKKGGNKDNKKHLTLGHSSSKSKRDVSAARYKKDLQTKQIYAPDEMKKANIFADFAEVKLLSPRIYEEMASSGGKQRKVSKHLTSGPTKKKKLKTKYKTMPPLGKLSAEERVFHTHKEDGREPVGFTDFTAEVDNYRKTGVKSRSSFSTNLKKSLNDAYLFSRQERLNPAEEGDELAHESSAVILSGAGSLHSGSRYSQRGQNFSMGGSLDRPASSSQIMYGDEINHNPSKNQRLKASKNPGNIPEWTTLRDTYIRQLQNLDSHEQTARERGVNSDISIPNFIGLLLAIRKISFRIVDSYKELVKTRDQDGHHATFAALHAYLIKMATDVNCINKQPFVDWMGVTPVYNTFFSERRIDGASALFAPLDKTPSGLKFQGDSENQPDSFHPPNKDDIFMHRDLQMTMKEQDIVDDMGQIIWTAYKNHHDMLRHKATAHSLENLYGLKNELISDGDEASSVKIGEAGLSTTLGLSTTVDPTQALYPQHDLTQAVAYDVVAAASAVDTLNLFHNVRPLAYRSNRPTLKEFWDLWRRTYHVKTGLRNLIDGRHYCIKRKVLVEWMRYAWQSIQFRKMQERRWHELTIWTFNGWVQYVYWCRRFNKVLERAIQENKRRVLYRMHVFAKLEFENRRFKYKRAIMPMVITFRALRHNALVNRFHVLQKLKRSSRYLLAELNLREFCFRRWQKYLKASYAVQTMDVAMLLWKMRDMFYDWKVATWPRKYGQKDTLQASGGIIFQPLNNWTDERGGFIGGVGRGGSDAGEEDDEYSLNTFNTANTKKSKKGWIDFALGG